METTTDCRTEEGITVAIIDTIINQFRLLRGRNLSSNPVQEALKDLFNDEDQSFIMSKFFDIDIEKEEIQGEWLQGRILSYKKSLLKNLLYKCTDKQRDAYDTKFKPGYKDSVIDNYINLVVRTIAK